MELNAQGQKTKGYVFSGSQGESDSNGSYLTTLEADPAGVNVGVEDPSIDPAPSGFSRDLDTKDKLTKFRTYQGPTQMWRGKPNRAMV